MPLDGALHLDDMGQAGAYGRNPDATPPTTPMVASGDDVASFEAALSKRWVHRDIHAEEGIDIDAVVAMLRQELAVARSRSERRAAVRRATCRLGDGQLRVAERADVLFSDTGLSVRAVGPAFLVEGTDGRYDGDLAAGDRIMEVDGVEVVRWVDSTCAAPGSSAGQRSAQLAFSLERGPASTSDDRRRAKTLTVRRAKTGKVREVGLQWRNEANVRCIDGEAITSDVGMVTVHSLDCDPAAFANQLTSATEAAGAGHLMLDLRRTLGDDEANAQLLARRFAPAATVWASKRPAARGGFSTIDLPEAGPPVQASARWLLMSPRCDGNCELAAAVIASDALVTTVGRPTAGSVSETDAISVGKGAMVHIPIVQYALPGTSTVLEGRGVTPDIEVTATIDVLKRGHDPEVVAVARRIAGQPQ